MVSKNKIKSSVFSASQECVEDENATTRRLLDKGVVRISSREIQDDSKLCHNPTDPPQEPPFTPPEEPPTTIPPEKQPEPVPEAPTPIAPEVPGQPGLLLQLIS
jgi:hypothetical protein